MKCELKSTYTRNLRKKKKRETTNVAGRGSALRGAGRLTHLHYCWYDTTSMYDTITDQGTRYQAWNTRYIYTSKCITYICIYGVPGGLVGYPRAY